MTAAQGWQQLRRTLYGLLLIALFAGCTGTSNITPPSPLTQIKPAISVKQDWQQTIGSGAEDQYLSLGPVLHGDTVYTSSYDGTISAVHVANGKLRWQQTLDAHISASPLVTPDAVYVGTMFGRLYKLNRQNGKKQWHVPVSSSIFSAPAYADGKVVVLTLDSAVSAYQASDGKELWQEGGSTPPLMLTGSSSPVIDTRNNQVYIGQANGELWALDLISGNKKWEAPVAIAQGSSDINRMVDINTTPIINKNIVYTATYQGNVAAIRARNGSPKWQKPFSTYQDMALSRGTLFLSDAKSHLIAMEADSGEVHWNQSVLKGRHISAPAVINGYVAVGDYAGYVHFFNAQTGKYAARIQAGSSGIPAAPAVRHKQLFVQTNDGTLTAISL